MQLTEEQQNAVRAWAAQGLGLSEIQKKIEDEFGLSPTYMDVRFLIIDLGITLRDKPASTVGASTDVSKAPATASPAGGGPAAQGASPDGGAVRVDVDVVTKPGAVVSGQVTFSDGVSAAWFLDQTGRLAIDAGQPGYKPSEQDLAEFQQELRDALAKKGY